MKVLIIEDEVPAAEKLERYISKYDNSIQVVGIINSIKESVHFLTDHLTTLDLIFMDIQLKDGLSFEIFDKVQVNKPVIFTTAFNEYAVDAFKVNSIAYLLKPITFTDLSIAMKKLDSLKAQFSSVEHANLMVEKLTRKNYKERFMVKVGDHIKSIKTEDIELFFAEGRDAYLVTNAKRKFIIDFKMEELQEMLNNTIFFRVNRTFIVNINAIKDVLVYSNSRLKITPTVDFDKEIIVSREKVTAFKEWFSGG
ncbi:MAG: LytTR family DNA-binding domain-containing protein [Cyclobacteriaceae bacterium]|nr:LytTR family DNA-binding domain-containing protein [Cyclobacteriaceae bacterium]